MQSKKFYLTTVKYAGVKECSLEIKRLVDTSIQIIIRDSGVGFNTENIGVKGSQGFGLFSIRERVRALLGGDFQIESSIGNGARFKITVPEQAAEEEISNSKKITSNIPDQNENRKDGLRILLVDDHKILRQSLLQPAYAM